MRRRGGDARFIDRNPRPARGEDVYSLTQLRHYIHLFWTDRRYGLCGLPGFRQAFLRFCGEPLDHHVMAKCVRRESEYFPSDLQRLLSKKIRQILAGRIIFVETSGSTSTWKPLMDTPQPPLDDAVPFHDFHFRLDWTAIGPRIRKI